MTATVLRFLSSMDRMGFDSNVEIHVVLHQETVCDSLEPPWQSGSNE